MLVFAAHTPHSPLLLSSINKHQMTKVEGTVEAMEELAKSLYAVQPDTILLFSEHPSVYKSTFSINLSDPYTFDLSEFGHLNVKKTLHPDLKLIDRIQRSVRKEYQPITLTTDENLNYASAIPLHFLTKHLPNVRLVPITHCDLDAKTHFQFGQSLKDAVMASARRIAVVAAGDMSHALTSESPAGFHKAGEAYDQKIQELISHKNTAGLIAMDQNVVEHAQQTNYLFVCMLFGLLERISVKPEILKYESPFGVGYLTANFHIH